MTFKIRRKNLNLTNYLPKSGRIDLVNIKEE